MLSKELLLSVSKPARYTAGEINVVKKDLSGVRVKVCLCFPDIYEIGMSHLGLRILYDLLNRHKDCAAERVFSPWVDMEERLRSGGISLSSLESGVAVRDFDILGFSLQYELSYTNVLNILSLSGLPLRSRDRGNEHPLIIAGGVSCLNPEPMADFIDAFVIGEAEEVILEIIEVYKRHKEGGSRDRRGLLVSLSLINGVYVPSQYDRHKGEKISKRFIRDLNKFLNIQDWVVPYIEIVHDRIGIEIMRGCPNHCRFCQARSCFYPVRLVAEDKILDTARRLYRKTGYEEISLLSLSSSDHPKIDRIIKCLTAEFKDKGVGISLPSLRVKNLVGELSEKLSSTRKTALTFALEAGSQRLRDLINKNVKMDELQSVASRAYQTGYRLLKLYFMIGLPTEANQDLKEILQLCQRLSLLKKDMDGYPAQLNISISNFVPKPHTPFQWQAMASMSQFFEKQKYLQSLFRTAKGTFRVRFHNVQMSFLEGVLSRGDRRLSNVISDAFSAGAKFDSWSDSFNFSLWLDSFSKNSIDPNEYLLSRSYSDTLSWDFIDVGIPKEQLARDAASAFSCYANPL